MILLKKVKAPEIEQNLQPVDLPDNVIIKRKQKILEKMREENLDALVIYADLEHGGNFEYLTGFRPRFEEALLVMHADGECFLVFGNENLNKAGKARIVAQAIHMPHFSLPNQPMETDKTIAEILEQTGLGTAKSIGLAGWKNFTSKKEDNEQLFDIPYYIVEGIKLLSPTSVVKNAAYLLIGENGVRTVNDADEFAHYEFGAALAGNCMLRTMDMLQEGMSEMEAAAYLDAYGQPHSVVTIMAAGERFVKANMYPTARKIKRGDALSITTGFRGGLQSRSGYAVKETAELPEARRDYLEKAAIPYYQAVVTWLEEIRIGMSGDMLYKKIEEILPKEIYHWTLNPGHLCAEEEWLSSPIYPGSTEKLKSGMLLQIDIIPSVSGYAGINCESGIFLADKTMRKEIQEKYPDLWKRIEKRRKYIKEVLGIDISEEILPTSSATAYCRPYLLNKEEALIKQRRI